MSGSLSRRWNLGPPAETTTSDEPDGTALLSDHAALQHDTSAADLSLAPRSSLQLLSPLHYQAGYQYPLLVWLHSAGHNERQIEQVMPYISTRNYVGLGVRAPRATDVRGFGFDWSTNPGAAAKACEHVCLAIEQAQAAFSVHPDRIILAGYGSGAAMACQVALLHSDRFAGVVRAGGEFPSSGDAALDFKRLRARRLPMLWLQAANGVDDEPQTLARDISMAQMIRAQVEIRQYQDDDVMNTTALKDIDRWCFDKIISPRPDATRVGDSVVDDADRTMVGFSSN
ncbi:alpha/beta hydrolase [Allorhodopirellula solitaria]|uniref:Alpha/beta hydrolase family protein n=1 Tax=Allorhodopirellula solitaria TaxID=2527987 RepID=A0A5C5XXR8_9BACT|nr:phospholipase [Allorhodopirellula solitaria]TWT67468.1 Alpha/beta hydrolase family protein [Allorhodopirellula solitaria]